MTKVASHGGPNTDAGLTSRSASCQQENDVNDDWPSRRVALPDHRETRVVR